MAKKQLTHRQKLTAAKKALKKSIKAHKDSMKALNLALQHTQDVEQVLTRYGAHCPESSASAAAAMPQAAYGAKCDR